MKKQVALFVVGGAIQYGVDGAFFVLLYLLGAPLGPANIVARGTAAAVGYFFNSRITFLSEHGHPPGELRRILKFVLTWGLLTLASTLLLMVIEALNSSARFGDMAVVGSKFAVEALLAAISFTAHKWWVFRDELSPSRQRA